MVLLRSQSTYSGSGERHVLNMHDRTIAVESQGAPPNQHNTIKDKIKAFRLIDVLTLL